jgi:cytochrome c peroxidase
MTKMVISGILLTTLVAISCTKPPQQPDLNNIRLNLPEQPYAYNTLQTQDGIRHLRYEDSSVIDNNKATIGRVLFYDKALSINNSISCASCHSQQNSFSDNVAFSKGFAEKLTLRNSINIVNLFDSRSAGYFWDGRESSIEDMVFAPIANHIEMGFSHIELITEKVGNLPYYKPLFRECYGDDRITEKRMKECLGQFLFSIVSYNNKFDKSLKNRSVLNIEERQGLYTFERHCMSCHRLTDEPPYAWQTDTAKYANIGLDEHDGDKGRNGLYKIPNLRNISKTAPYMHDGRFNNLEEVITHYTEGIKRNPNLSEALGGKDGPMQIYLWGNEKFYLIQFLKALDDDVVIHDPKLASPFK